jgi:hypothetical protein
MEFESIEQIREEFEIDSAEPEQVRKELIGRLAEIHPDRREDGELSSEDEERWTKIQNAVDFIDSDETQMMVPARQVTALQKKVDELSLTAKSNEAETQLSENIRDQESRIRSYGRGPRITSTAVTTVLTGLIAFPEYTSNHPILSEFINFQSTTFIIIWIYCLIFTGMVWWMTKRIESRKRDILDALKSERLQNDLFYRFLGSMLEKEEAPRKTFTKSRFIDFVTDTLERKASNLFDKLFGAQRTTSAEVVESLAESTLVRAERNGVIEAATDPSLDEKYRIEVDPAEVAIAPDKDLKILSYA